MDLKRLRVKTHIYLFRRWTKWKVSERDVEMVEVHYSNIEPGRVVSKRKLRVDILRRENKFTGDVQYKNVKHY